MKITSQCDSLARLLALLFAGCIFASPATVAEPQVRRELFAQPGTVIPARLVHVSPTVPAQVTQVRVDVGDAVKAGEVLAELDGTRATLKVELAQAEVEIARARLMAVKAALGEKERQQSPGKERLGVAEAEIKSAEARLRLAQYDLKSTQIRAPSDGTILARRVQVGDVVGLQPDHSRTASFDMADLRHLEVVVEVPENNVKDVLKGQPCRMGGSSASSVVYHGKVVRVSPVADPATRCFRTYIDVHLPEKGNRLLPGMYAVVQFLAKE